MARPKKETVDYFPHNCNHGKTIFIIEQKYGNEGYAFWFKLLELLGKTPNHYIDCNNISDWEFLQAITRLNEQTTVDILNILSSLQAIDTELWSKKVIWCQKFVDGIADVYKNRRVETPSKPNNYKQKLAEDDITTSKSTQSKLKETKEKEINIVFDTFWDLYDKKVGDKEKLIKKWNNMSDDDRTKIIQHIPKYKISQSEKKYRKDPSTYFNNKSWNDEIIYSEQVTETQKNGYTPTFKNEYETIPTKPVKL